MTAPARELLDPLEMLLDAARFVEYSKPAWAKAARAAVAHALSAGAAQPSSDPSIWERCAHICDRSAELHRGAMEAESVTGQTIRRIRIEEAEWIAKTIWLSEKQASSLSSTDGGPQ